MWQKAEKLIMSEKKQRKRFKLVFDQETHHKKSCRIPIFVYCPVRSCRIMDFEKIIHFPRLSTLLVVILDSILSDISNCHLFSKNCIMVA